MFHADSYCVKLFILLLFCPVSSPRRFRAKILSPTQLQVSWKEPKGEFESYKVVYATLPGKIQHPSEDMLSLIFTFNIEGGQVCVSLPTVCVEFSETDSVVILCPQLEILFRLF